MDPTLLHIKAQLAFRKHIMDELYETNKEIIQGDHHEELKFEHLRGQIVGLELSVEALTIRQEMVDKIEKIKKRLFFIILLTVSTNIILQIIHMTMIGFDWDKVNLIVWSLCCLAFTFDTDFFKRKK